ncbi:MAG: DUF4180 domain-containing protein [Solitalea sp.]
MNIKIHTVNGIKIAELVSDEPVINKLEDGVDLVGNVYYQDAERVFLHENAVSPAFFDLKTKLAGDILQKFSNYRMRLAIVGDFEKYPSKSLQDFIRESNQGKRINFVSSPAEALTVLSAG